MRLASVLLALMGLCATSACERTPSFGADAGTDAPPPEELDGGRDPDGGSGPDGGRDPDGGYDGH